MYSIEERYYKINRILLKILGLWPYQQSYFTRIHKALFICICLTFIFVQLLVFITTQYNTHLLLKIFSFVFPTLFVTIKYFLFAVQVDNIKQLLKQIQNDWKLLQNDFEIDIIEKYACNARFFTIIVMAFYYSGIFIFAIFQFWPLVLDIILPLNISRPYQYIIVKEYFINQEKYFYVLLLHEVLAVCIGATAVCATITIITLYSLHACALFNIASYRIENVIDKAALALPGPTREYLFYHRIICAVVIHQRAIECTVFVASNFALLFFILIIVGISSLSINLFQFVELMTLTTNTNQAFIIAMLIGFHLVYMYICNYTGQEVIDHEVQFSKATYNGLWYAAPLHTQKLLLFILQKGTINNTVEIGGIFVPSLKGFATLVNMAISYFTLMYSQR